MSWGERSCAGDCRMPGGATPQTCNVTCTGYRWDGVTKPDSTVSQSVFDGSVYTGSSQPQRTMNRAERRAAGQRGKK